MNEICNENKLFVVKEYEFENPLFQNINSIIDKCGRDCHYKYFHTFEYECVYNLTFTKIINNETVNFAVSEKQSTIYKLNKKLTLARERGFIFNQIKNFKIKIYSNLLNINIRHYLKLSIPIMHRRFLIKISS